MRWRTAEMNALHVRSQLALSDGPDVTTNPCPFGKQGMRPRHRSDTAFHCAGENFWWDMSRRQPDQRKSYSQGILGAMIHLPHHQNLTLVGLALGHGPSAQRGIGSNEA